MLKGGVCHQCCMPGWEAEQPQQLLPCPLCCCRHLHRHSDSAQLLRVQTYHQHYSHALTTAHTSSQHHSCAVSYLAQRGLGQVVATFWPQCPYAQDSAAADLLPSFLLQHDKRLSADAGSRLTHVLTQLGHQVFLSEQGLVDVSIQPLDAPNQPMPEQEPQQLQQVLPAPGPAAACCGSVVCNFSLQQEPLAAAGDSSCSQVFNCSRQISPLTRHIHLMVSDRDKQSSIKQQGLFQRLVAKAAQKAGLPTKDLSSKAGSYPSSSNRPSCTAVAGDVQATAAVAGIGGPVALDSHDHPTGNWDIAAVCAHTSRPVSGVSEETRAATAALQHAFFGDSKWGFVTPPNTPRITTAGPTRQCQQLSRAVAAAVLHSSNSGCDSSQLSSCTQHLQHQQHHSLATSSSSTTPVVDHGCSAFARLHHHDQVHSADLECHLQTSCGHPQLFGDCSSLGCK